MNLMPMPLPSTLVLKDGLGRIPQGNPLKLGHTLVRAHMWRGTLAVQRELVCVPSPPRVIHTDTMRHRLGLNAGPHWTRACFDDPRRCRAFAGPLPTQTRTLAVLPCANSAKLYLIRVISAPAAAPTVQLIPKNKFQR